jgi:hypothetical protein
MNPTSLFKVEMELMVIQKTSYTGDDVGSLKSKNTLRGHAFVFQVQTRVNLKSKKNYQYKKLYKK